MARIIEYHEFLNKVYPIIREIRPFALFVIKTVR